MKNPALFYLTVGALQAVALVTIMYVTIAPHHAHACDCTDYAFHALRSVGLKLKTVPAVALTLERSRYKQGVTWINKADERPNHPCQVEVHEFVHHYQWLRDGDAITAGQWWQRENDADITTRYAQAQYGECEK